MRRPGKTPSAESVGDTESLEKLRRVKPRHSPGEATQPLVDVPARGSRRRWAARRLPACQRTREAPARPSAAQCKVPKQCKSMLSETTPILHHERHERVPSRADRGVGVIVVVELPLLGLASSVTRGVEVLLNVVPTHRRAAAVDDKVAARAKEVLPYYVARAIRVARTKTGKLPAKVMLGGTSLT